MTSEELRARQEELKARRGISRVITRKRLRDQNRIRDKEECLDLRPKHDAGHYLPPVVREYLRFKRIAEMGGPDATQQGSQLLSTRPLPRVVDRNWSESNVILGIKPIWWLRSSK
jgi:hypothetical protein